MPFGGVFPSNTMKKINFPIITRTRAILGTLYAPEKEKFPVVIFCHALGADVSHFSLTAEQFASGGVGALLFPFAGGSPFDKSLLPMEKMTVFTEEEDLNAAIFALLKSDFAEQIFLFGASQGGLVAALSAEKFFGKISGMVLLYPGFCIADHWNSRYPRDEDLPPFLNLWGVTLGREYFSSLRGFRVFEEVGNFQGPVLIFHGAKDPLVPLPYSEAAQKRYRRARLIVYPEEGHGFSKEGNKKTSALSLAFFGNILAGKDPFAF